MREPETLLGVALEDLPLLGRGLAGLDQDLDRDGDLADVVQQRRPAELLPVEVVEPHLAGDHLGEHQDALGVAAGLPVVAAQRPDQREDAAGGVDEGLVVGGGLGLGEQALDRVRAGRATGHGVPLGGPTGEHHAHLEQRRQREEPTAQRDQAVEHEQRDGQDGEPARDPQHSGGRRRHPGEEQTGAGGQHGRQQGGRGAQQAGGLRVGSPRLVAGGVRGGARVRPCRAGTHRGSLGSADGAVASSSAPGQGDLQQRADLDSSFTLVAQSRSTRSAVSLRGWLGAGWETGAAVPTPPRSTRDDPASPRHPRRPRRRRHDRRHRRRGRDAGVVPGVRLLGHLLPGAARRPRRSQAGAPPDPVPDVGDGPAPGPRAT